MLFLVFVTIFPQDLIKEFKGELGGKLLDVVNGLMMTPEKYDAYQLHKAIKVQLPLVTVTKPQLISYKCAKAFVGVTCLILSLV